MLTNEPVTLYSHAGKVKRGKPFDVRSYIDRRTARIRAGEPADPRVPDQPCHELDSRCSGCPAPKDGELCWRFNMEIEGSER